MSKNIDLSIYIPTFTRIKWLKKCVQSIQTKFKHINHEIIINDAGSEDGTIEYINKLEKTTNNIIGIYGKREGMMIAYKQAYEAMNGNYILLANDDVVFYPRPFKTAIRLMDKDENLGVVSPKAKEHRWGNIPHAITFYDFELILPGFFITRKSMLDDFGDEVFYYDNRKTYIEHDWNMNVLSKGYTLLFLRECGLLHYRLEDHKRKVYQETRPFSSETVDEDLKNKYHDVTSCLTGYLNCSRWRRFRKRRFHVLNSIRKMEKRYAIYSTRRLFNNCFVHVTYDWLLDSMVVFRDERYSLNPDCYICQRLPDEVVECMK